MRLQDDIDFTTLNWVKRELDETLRQAHQALEAFVEDPEDLAQMRFCATYLHQVQGTLRMVELYGAAMVVEEMERLAGDLLEGKVNQKEDAYSVLMRGIVQLPDYLERLQSGHRDIPIVLLPLLNDLRACRGEALLSESVLFSPDMSLPLPDNLPTPPRAYEESTLKAGAAKLRMAFQVCLLRFFKAQDLDQVLPRMSLVMNRLLSVSSVTDARRLWWVSAGVIESVARGGLEPSVALKLLIGRVDREIKRLVDGGEGELAAFPPTELVRSLLYYVAHASKHGFIGEQVRTTYRLDMLLPSESELEHARGSISGHNKTLLDTVSVAIKDDLLRIKDALDLFLRTGSNDVTDLAPQSDALRRVADTLGMLGLGVPRRVVQDQQAAVDELVAGKRTVDEPALLDIAGALLYVEASLDDHIDRLGAAGADDGDSGASLELPQAEVRKILEALMKEASGNLQQAKQDIVAFVEAPWDHSRIEQIPRLLEEIGGALRMLALDEPAQLIGAVGRFSEIELTQRRRVPTSEQLDTLADALASIEYYLEALKEQRAGRDRILDVTRTSMESLGYWPPGAELGAELAAEEIPSPVSSELPASEDVDRAMEQSSGFPSLADDFSEPAPSRMDELELSSDEGELGTTQIDSGDVGSYVERIGVAEPGLEFEPPEEQEPEPQPMEMDAVVDIAPGKGVEDLVIGSPAERPLEHPPEQNIDGMRLAEAPEAPEPSSASLTDVEAEARSSEADIPAHARSEDQAEPATPADEVTQSLASDALASEEPVAEAVPASELAEPEPEHQPEPVAEVQPPAEPEPVEAEPEYALPDDLGPAFESTSFQAVPNDDVDEEILEVFVEEVQEEIENINRQLPLWKANVDNFEELKPIRRSFHTLKGSGRLVGAMALGEFSWKIENMLNRVLDKSISPGPSVAGVLEHAVGALPQLLDGLKGEGAPTLPLGAIMHVADRVSDGEELLLESLMVRRKGGSESGKSAAADEDVPVDTAAGAESAPEGVEQSATDASAVDVPEDHDRQAQQAQIAEQVLSAHGEYPQSVAVGAEPEPDTGAAGQDLSTEVAEQVDVDQDPSRADTVATGAAQVEPLPHGAGSIDPVLFEILGSEVSAHLSVVTEYLEESDQGRQPRQVSEKLMRAVHTLNGAISMVDIPVITAVVGPCEGYVKRLFAIGAAPSAEGYLALENVCSLVTAVMSELDSTRPEFPDSEPLSQQLILLRDSLPEASSIGSLYQMAADEESSHAEFALNADDDADAVPVEEGLSELVIDSDESPAHGQEAPESSTVQEDIERADSAQGQRAVPEFDETVLAIDSEQPEQFFSLELDEDDESVTDVLSADGDITGLVSDTALQQADSELESEQADEAVPVDLADSSGLELTSETDAESTLDLELASEFDAERTLDLELTSEIDAERTLDLELTSEIDAERTLDLELTSGSDADAALDVTLSDDSEAPWVATDGVAVQQPGSDVSADELSLDTPDDEAIDTIGSGEIELDLGDLDDVDEAGLEQEIEAAVRDRNAEQRQADERLPRPGAEDADLSAWLAQQVEAEQTEGLSEEASTEAPQSSDQAAAWSGDTPEIELDEDFQSSLAELGSELGSSADSGLSLDEELGTEADFTAELEALFADGTAERLAEAAASSTAAPEGETEQRGIEDAAVASDDEHLAMLSDHEPGDDSDEEAKVSLMEASADVDGQDETLADEVVDVQEPVQQQVSVEQDSGAFGSRPTDTYRYAGLATRILSMGNEPEQRLELPDMDEDLLDIFVQEGREILDHSDTMMARLRENPQNLEIVNEIQREMHTLKGGARMAGLAPVGDLGHAMESLLEAVSEERTEVKPIHLEALERAFDRLHAMVERVDRRLTISLPDQAINLFEALVTGDLSEFDVSPELEPLDELELAEQPQGEQVQTDDEDEPQEQPVAAVPQRRRQAPTRADTDEEFASRSQQEIIRVRSDLLDSLVNYAGEVSIYRGRLEQQVGTFRFNLIELEQTVSRLRDQLRKLEIETEAQILSRFQREAEEVGDGFDPLELDRFSTVQQLSRALAESVSDLVALQNLLDDLTRQSETLLLQQSRVSSDLQEGLMRTRMVPFESLVPRLRRILRQTAGELDKRAQLRVEGAQGEMDRTVLERMTAPLEHMLRNALAHGLETPEQRLMSGKPAEGTIRIEVSREATEVLIRVSDDGAGIDPQMVRRKAIERGLLKPDAQLGERDLFGFILESGFSTAEAVTKVAGRGVGMDVVNSEIKQLGGSLQIDSTRGQGTVFTVRLPFTLAVTQAIMIRVGDVNYAVPMSSVQGVLRMPREEIDRRFRERDMEFQYSGESFVLYDLGAMLGVPISAQVSDDGQAPLLMTRTGDQRAAIRVDAVLGGKEIVVKSVGPQLSSVSGIFGATIMGDGRVVIILDFAPLVRRFAAQRLAGEGQERPIEVRPVAQVVEKRLPLIMVIDDSITMRKVTTRVLERNDMDVFTAKDGLDAVEQLQDRIPDVILLDIEMPRMDGYELATYVRNDSRLKHIPIIMITSRTGEKHRQRALEIGVNRYLGKPYQEADLLQNVQDALTENA